MQLSTVFVARKRLQYNSNDTGVLQLLQGAKQGHPNIHLQLAIIRQPRPSEGSTHSRNCEHILFDWAPLGDLEIFLRGGLNHDEQQIDVFRRQFPYLCPRGSGAFTQARNLASALEWLHEGTTNRPCAHMDLKLANVLVCSPNDRDHPVGV